jgi:hypothetical protein
MVQKIHHFCQNFKSQFLFSFCKTQQVAELCRQRRTRQRTLTLLQMSLDHIVAATSGKNNKNKNSKNPDLVSFVHAPG